MSDLRQLSQKIEALEAELAGLRSLITQRHAFDAPRPALTLTERRRLEFAAALAEPRRVVRLQATNAATGWRLDCARYSARQLERFAFRFARLQSPTRKMWRGDREAFGIMRELFAQFGGIVRNTGRAWAWAVDAPQRREIAARIASTPPRPKRAAAPSAGVNA